jgi:hypothetical protein
MINQKRETRAVTQPTLHRPGLLQDVIDHLERQVLGQLAQMARGVHPGSHSDGTVDRESGRLSRQRDRW